MTSKLGEPVLVGIPIDLEVDKKEALILPVFSHPSGGVDSASGDINIGGVQLQNSVNSTKKENDVAFDIGQI